MTSPEELYASYMDDAELVPVDKNIPPVADWGRQLAWSKVDMRAMGAAAESLGDDAEIESARLIGAASILGTAKERMISFTTVTNGEYLVHMKRRAAVGCVALQSQAEGAPIANRPFLRVDGKVLAVYYKGLATPPTAAGSHMFLYDQLRVGDSACLTWPVVRGQHTPNYRIPSAIESMRVVPEMPEWVERLLYPGRLYEP